MKTLRFDQSWLVISPTRNDQWKWFCFATSLFPPNYMGFLWFLVNLPFIEVHRGFSKAPKYESFSVEPPGNQQLRCPGLCLPINGLTR